MPACTSCHGPGGNSTANANPKLAGQHAAYIEKQLKDFKAKTERNQPVMSLYAGALSDQDMKDIGAYIAKQPAWKPSSAKNKDTIELGQKLYRGGDAKRGIAACAGCHGPAGAVFRRSIRASAASLPSTPRRSWSRSRTAAAATAFRCTIWPGA